MDSTRRLWSVDGCIAVGLPLVLAGIWGAMRVDSSGDATFFPGWISLGLLTAALVTTVHESLASGTPVSSSHLSRRRGLHWVFFPPETLAAVAILVIGGHHHLGWGSAFHAALLLAAWVWLCAGVARFCRHSGFAAAIALGMTISMTLLAAPVIFSPLLHAAAGTPVQHLFAQGLVYACPIMGELDAIRPAVRVDWSVLPGMYAYSGLGQEVPVSLPPWWISALIYAFCGQSLSALAVAATKKAASACDTPQARM